MILERKDMIIYFSCLIDIAVTQTIHLKKHSVLINNTI
jgi:hypothetical protein